MRILSALLLLPLFCARAFASDDEFLREAFWSRLVTAPPSQRPSVGLALSGGGARGFAHTGVLEALGYHAFPVDYISGTSMGALIGAIYATGRPIEELWAAGRDAAELNISRDFRSVRILPLIIADRLVTPKYITRYIEGRLGGLSFGDLKVPFACTAMDIRTGEKVLFTEGPLDVAVRASVNLPGLFAPVRYRHRHLVDGGVVDNVPVSSARELGAEWVLASVMETTLDKNPESALMTLLQVIDIRGSLLAREAERSADFVLRTQTGDMTVADFDRCVEAGEEGLRETSRRADEARDSLLVNSLPRLAEGL